MTSLPRAANLSSAEDRKTSDGSDISPQQQHSSPANSDDGTPVRLNNNTEPKPSPELGPFASTLNRERNDLSEQVLRDLNRHKVSRELAQSVFRRWTTEAPTTANFRLDKVPTCPALVGSVSSCSETSMLGLHSRQNSDEHTASSERPAAFDAQEGEHQSEQPGMCSHQSVPLPPLPLSQRRMRCALSHDITPTFRKPRQESFAAR